MSDVGFEMVLRRKCSSFFVRVQGRPLVFAKSFGLSCRGSLFTSLVSEHVLVCLPVRAIFCCVLCRERDTGFTPRANRARSVRQRGISAFVFCVFFQIWSAFSSDRFPSCFLLHFFCFPLGALFCEVPLTLLLLTIKHAWLFTWHLLSWRGRLASAIYQEGGVAPRVIRRNPTIGSGQVTRHVDAWQQVRSTGRRSDSFFARHG